MNLKLEDIFTACKAFGDLGEFGSKEVKSIKIDSRVVDKGSVFFCIQGKNFDGHSFAKEAENKGALALVVHRALDFEPKVPVFLVDDTTKALGRVANLLRKKTKAKVVAFTGSAGKTTTKEMSYSLLKTKYSVGKNFKNWNNQIGVPLSIFQFTGEEDIWLLEVGINNNKDMDELGEIIEPDVAVIVNVGPCHLEGLKNVKEVAKNKTKILKFISRDGVCFLNDKCLELVSEVNKYEGVNKIFFTEQRDVEVKLKDFRKNKGVFEISFHGKVLEQEFPFWGVHFEDNLKMALLLADYFGLSFEEIKRGFNNLSLPTQRFNVSKVNNFWVIDDTYNANPLSMQASLKSAALMSKNLPLVLILGDMAELGEAEEVEHAKLGSFLKEIKPYLVFYKGKKFSVVKENYGKNNILQINTEEEFISYFKHYNLKQGVLLFKASRSVRLEDFLNKFKSEF